MGTNLIEVTLEKIHTHAGREHPVGSKIDVTLNEAKFLLNNKVIKSIPAAALAKAEKTEKSGE
jgi:hypothetical protein